MIRRISTKWLLAVLAAVVVPFSVFAYFVNTKVTERLGEDVVRFHLLSMAGDLGDRIDEEVEERRNDVELVSSIPEVNWFVDGLDDDRGTFQANVELILDRLVLGRQVYDYVLALDKSGRVVGMNTVGPSGEEVGALAENYFFSTDFTGEDWFQEAMAERVSQDDFHALSLGAATPGEPLPAEGPPTEHYVSFVQRIEPLSNQDGPVGVLVALMNWKHIQEAVGRFGVRRLGDGASELHQEDIYASSYAWIWMADANTIIAHPNRDLYGQKVEKLEDGQLIGMVHAAREARWGMFPDYSFRGIEKKAAFKHCRGSEQGGFGWVVGVGVNNADIFATADQLSRWLITLSVSILILTVVLTAYIAYRTTRPIRELEQHFDRVGHGDLDAHIEVRSGDELGQLAQSFNRMTAELKANRAQLVQAEKEAAWRGMARQVAHEIKNPLTPISLTLGLLKRSRDENSPDFDSILKRTIDVIQRQVESMRKVVGDFTALAGVPRALASVNVYAVLLDTLELHRAGAEEQGVDLCAPNLKGSLPPLAQADQSELQRALVNLVSNALDAMPAGGKLCSEVTVTERDVLIELADTGSGISTEAADHLFEPHFTTRSAGTGLGLAIARRVVEDAGGSISLENATEGPGAVARVTLLRSGGADAGAEPAGPESGPSS
jgi:signal transduction histidine kinase